MYEMDWVNAEFECVPIDDERIVKRLAKTTGLLFQNPSSSIPEACNSWAETKGAYRLLDNDKVTPTSVITGHRQQTIERMKQHNIVLNIQDTTSLNYSNLLNTADLGLYSDSETAKGLLLHSSFAVTPDGVPLGILWQEYWSRDPEKRGKKHSRHKLSTEEKESNKWLKTLDFSLKGIPNNITVVTVCDREADIYDFLNKAVSENRHLLIRVAQNRQITEENETLIQQVESQSYAGEILVSIPRDIQHKIPPRDARLSINFCPVTVKPPKNRNDAKGLPNLNLYAVLAEETNPPEGIEPIRWILLTTLPVTTFDDAVEKIKWYRQRWKTERYHLPLLSSFFS